MFHFIVGTACLLFIFMVLPDLIWIGLLLLGVALILAVVGAIVVALIAWPKLGIWLIAMVVYMILTFAYYWAKDALNARFPHSMTYYAGLLYARLTK